MATRLLGLDGIEVVEVDTEPDGSVTVWARTAPGVPVACPERGTASVRVKEWTVTSPSDLGGDRLRWVKRRWRCRAPDRPRGSFTEALPQVPAGCRLTQRLRATIGAEIAEQGRTVTEVAASRGCSWPTAHEAFVAHADPYLAEPIRRVRVLGIDEHRRGRPRWRRDETTGKYTTVVERWHTCFYDLSGPQGLLGQVEGRTSDDAAFWLDRTPPAFRQAIDVVVIDMCTIYLAAIRRALPHAAVAVDPFHVVQLANNKVADLRRRITRERYGRRGRTGDPEYRVKNLLVRNLENLSERQITKPWNTLDGDGTTGTRHILAGWIVKEKLRHVLALSASRTGLTPTAWQVHAALHDFYTWSAACEDIPEIISQATTIDRWAATRADRRTHPVTTV